MDFTIEDLLEIADRMIADLLVRHECEESDVNAIALAQEAFHLTIREQEDEEESAYPAAPRFRSKYRGKEIVLRVEQSEETRQLICARACVQELLPVILAKLGVAPGTENKSARTTLQNLLTPRLLLPNRMFEKEARKAGYDLWLLKELFPNVSYEMLAQRFLDLEEICVIAVVDDGIVSSRRGNRLQASKKLTPAEEKCLNLVTETGEPQMARQADWSVRGWPIPTGPFNRIILRAVPDEI